MCMVNLMKAKRFSKLAEKARDQLNLDANQSLETKTEFISWGNYGSPIEVHPLALEPWDFCLNRSPLVAYQAKASVLHHE